MKGIRLFFILLNTTLSFSELKVTQALIIVHRLIWIYLARMTLKRIQSLNVFYCKKTLSKSTIPRLLYILLGNLSTGDLCCKCCYGNTIGHEARRTGWKYYYNSNNHCTQFYSNYNNITRHQLLHVSNLIVPSPGSTQLFYIVVCSLMMGK
jgi:hypothetical protein